MAVSLPFLASLLYAKRQGYNKQYLAGHGIGAKEEQKERQKKGKHSKRRKTKSSAKKSSSSDDSGDSSASDSDTARHKKKKSKNDSHHHSNKRKRASASSSSDDSTSSNYSTDEQHKKKKSKNEPQQRSSKKRSRTTDHQNRVAAVKEEFCQLQRTIIEEMSSGKTVQEQKHKMARLTSLKQTLMRLRSERGSEIGDDNLFFSPAEYDQFESNLEHAHVAVDESDEESLDSDGDVKMKQKSFAPTRGAKKHPEIMKNEKTAFSKKQKMKKSPAAAASAQEKKPSTQAAAAAAAGPAKKPSAQEKKPSAQEAAAGLGAVAGQSKAAAPARALTPLQYKTKIRKAVEKLEDWVKKYPVHAHVESWQKDLVKLRAGKQNAMHEEKKSESEEQKVGHKARVEIPNLSSYAPSDIDDDEVRCSHS
jgi:hypothetical protein